MDPNQQETNSENLPSIPPTSTTEEKSDQPISAKDNSEKAEETALEEKKEDISNDDKNNNSNNTPTTTIENEKGEEGGNDNTDNNSNENKSTNDNESNDDRPDENTSSRPQSQYSRGSNSGETEEREIAEEEDNEYEISGEEGEPIDDGGDEEIDISNNDDNNSDNNSTNNNGDSRPFSRFSYGISQGSAISTLSMDESFGNDDNNNSNNPLQSARSTDSYGVEDEDVSIRSSPRSRPQSGGLPNNNGTSKNDNYLHYNPISMIEARNMSLPEKRKLYLGMLEELKGEQEKLKKKNEGLQNSISNHFARTQQQQQMIMMEEVLHSTQIDKSAAEQERLLKILEDYRRSRAELKDIRTYFHNTIREMQNRLGDKEAKATEVKEAFLEFKREIAKEAENSKT